MPLDIDKTYASLNAPTVGQLAFWTTTYITEMAERVLAGLHRYAVASAIDGRTIKTEGVIGDGSWLAPATVRELDAEDPTRTAIGPATRYVTGETAYTFWPSTPAVVQAIQRRSIATTDSIPEVLFDLARLAVIAEARAGETDGAMPEVAAAIRSVVGAVHAVLKEKW